jgi:hypothetical protein
MPGRTGAPPGCWSCGKTNRCNTGCWRSANGDGRRLARGPKNRLGRIRREWVLRPNDPTIPILIRTLRKADAAVAAATAAPAYRRLPCTLSAQRTPSSSSGESALRGLHHVRIVADHRAFLMAVERLELRGDAEWGNEGVMARAEREGLPYLFRLRVHISRTSAGLP